ncbi:hypothetical protein PanWU01x14_167640 [Parasponia andersonii]|uniref:Uncharacterized protein n=1 Tax=Parasponia andersonii TaxID=3476 RepID=A0A2P5CBF2_PARAD|nr:hypothetical protein PanWU01x14_167640 [Parasponia andersonii]
MARAIKVALPKTDYVLVRFATDWFCKERFSAGITSILADAGGNHHNILFRDVTSDEIVIMKPPNFVEHYIKETEQRR